MNGAERREKVEWVAAALAKTAKREQGKAGKVKKAGVGGGVGGGVGVVSSISTARWGLGVAVVDGKMYVVGGKNNTGTTLSSVEGFDPSTGQWSGECFNTMRTARYSHGVAVLDF